MNSSGLHDETTTLSDVFEFEIESLRPLTDTPTWYTYLLCSVLLLSLIAGIGGNASLFGLIVYVRKWVVRAPREESAPPIADSTKSCIMLLCLVNLTISVSVAPVILDHLIGMWLLGDGACKLYRTVAAGGNIMANFLIAGIAYDRFLAVSAYSSEATSRRRPCSISRWLIGFSLTTSLLTIPTLIYSGVEAVTLSQTIDQPGLITLVQMDKCCEMLPKSIFYWSVFSNAFIGFVLPLTMTTYFDLSVVRALYFSTTEIEPKQRKVAERRVAVCTAFVGLLHFVCCLPHWSFAVYANVVFSGRNSETAPSYVVVEFFGVFRFISSAFSWIPAGLLNDHLELLEVCDGGQRQSSPRNYELCEIQLLRRRNIVPFSYRQHSQMPTQRSTLSCPVDESVADESCA